MQYMITICELHIPINSYTMYLQENQNSRINIVIIY